MKIIFGKQLWLQAAAFYLRTLIFVEEQGINPKEEFDQIDAEQPFYLVIYLEQQPVATGRYQQDNALTLHPDRICVDKHFRKQGLGLRILQELEQYGKENGCQVSYLHSEVSAISFYQKLAYTVCSEEFFEDGILCVAMQKNI